MKEHFRYLSPGLPVGNPRLASAVHKSLRIIVLLGAVALAYPGTLHADTGGSFAEALSIKSAQPEHHPLAAESAVRPSAARSSLTDDNDDEQVQLNFAGIGLIFGTLLLSLVTSAFSFATRFFAVPPPEPELQPALYPPELPVPPELDRSLDAEQECREMLQSAVELWRAAESAILVLEADQPLRALMERELKIIGHRLSMHPELNSLNSGALTVVYSSHYWRMLHRELSRACRALTRICSVAKAGGESQGSRTALPQLPKTVTDAYFVLGVNSEVNEETLKRLVRALRQCWHPDLAQSAVDRDYREARIRQINVAFELINKRAAAA